MLIEKEIFACIQIRVCIMSDSERLKKFRTRWLRWLGQKTRCDKDNWVELLDCNWSGWVTDVLSKSGIEVKWVPLKNQNCETVKKEWSIAIREASMNDLIRLDSIFCTDLISKKGW